MSDGNTTLLVFRVIGERRVPYLIELDAEMTVVSDAPADSSVPPPAAIPAAVLEHYPDLDNPFFSAGVYHTEQLPGGGKRVLFKPTPLDVKVGTWVTPSVEENPIPGTDELRAEFFAAEQSMRAQHAAQGTACSDCDLGSLIRRYRQKLFTAGHLDPYLSLSGSSVTN